MSRSTIPFKRWESRERSSWSFQVFQKHNKQLSRMYISHMAAYEFTYRTLGKTAKWEDKTDNYFKFKDPTHVNSFTDVKAWSESYNDFDNWVNLNSVMAMSSNLETYIATIIKLALESDVGLLFGASRKIDGIGIIKHGKAQPFDFNDKVMSCTKGDWYSRVNSYEKIFGSAPDKLKDNISSLDKIRQLRNRVGHSFGRDIEMSRNHDAIDILPMDKLTREKTLEYQSLLYGVARSIDKHLLVDYVGEYQTLYFYHNLLKTLPDTEHYKNHGNRIVLLKKELGRFGAYKAGKNFCSELINYYDKL
ncbi:hypothetical protein [Vibrio cyclitrophicus]|uniref:hypothetical protein n=1 Tax=Vibrio cyclitrophicus TaxID=47951 RepID=UPI0003146568|nr:hypothetical protein [Vibrio cyclitrophicus]ERM61461.1 hypothetical protein M565_ctg1P1653 [Vibrio cyclitrophicus FF75]OEE46693.1 hypothetical protein OAG_04380 [Vibrio cyclitrophicus FF75]